MSWTLRYEEGYSGTHTVVRVIRVCEKGLKQGRKRAGWADPTEPWGSSWHPETPGRV